MQIQTIASSIPLTITTPTSPQNEQASGSLNGRKVAVLELDEMIDQTVRKEKLKTNSGIVIAIAGAVAWAATVVFALSLTIVHPSFIYLSLYSTIGSLALGVAGLVGGLSLWWEDIGKEIDAHKKPLKAFISQHFKDTPMTPKMIVHIYQHMKKGVYRQADTLAKREHNAKMATALQRLQIEASKPRTANLVYKNFAAKLANFFAKQAGNHNYV